MNTESVRYMGKVVFLILTMTFVVDKIVFVVFNTISDGVYTGQSIGKLNHFLSVKDTIGFVIFGSSRANHSIDPVILSANSFNMGMDGRNIAYTATLIKLLPKRQKQVILLHIDPEDAFNKNYAGDDIKALSSKYNRNKTIKTEMDKLNQSNILQNYYWSLSYNGAVLGIIKNYAKPNYNYKTYFGFDPIVVSEHQRKIFENILLKEESEHCQDSFALNNLYDRYIDELKLFCNENNKTLIIFTSPEFKDNCKNDNIQFNQIMKNKVITYYDLADYFKNRNLIEYWKDGTHLSNAGAKIFTEEIRQLLNQN